MKEKYIEHNNEGYRIKNTRISLDSIVYAYKDGLSPETIATECLPVLTLEQVYGAIAFYLANRKEIDAYLKQNETKYEELWKMTHQSDPEFYQRFKQTRRQMEVIGV